MTALHTYTCRFCGEKYTEECPSIGGRIIAPPMCEKCANGTDRTPPAKEESNIPRALDSSWPERHVSDLATYNGASYDKAKALWNSHLSQRPSTLILYGPRGRGKTGMAVLWAWMRGQSGRSPGTYCTAYGLFALIRRSWHPSSKETEWDALRPFQKTPYLVIDQMHQCRALSAADDKASVWERMALAELLDYRYREGKTSILIATLTTQTELREALDADILDRVNESGGIINCEWGSYRA